MTDQDQIDTMRNLGRCYADGLRAIGKPVPDQSDLMHGLAVTVRGESDGWDMAFQGVMAMVTKAAFEQARRIVDAH